jgi:hypothetical protein
MPLRKKKPAHKKKWFQKNIENESKRIPFIALTPLFPSPIKWARGMVAITAETLIELVQANRKQFLLEAEWLKGV